MSLYAIYLPILFFTVNDGFDNELNTLQNMENQIFDMIETPMKYYLSSNAEKTDLNLMLGVAIMKGQLMSCTDRSRFNFNGGIDRKYILTEMVNKLYAKFYENFNNKLTDLKTTNRMLDYHLWTSLPKILHKSHVMLPREFNEDFFDKSDLYFRNISDKCIEQMISVCEISPECYRPELNDEYFGYALTHQVLYIHILNKMNCRKSPTFQKNLEKIIHNRCSKIFNEAMYISNDFNMLKKYKDLFIEQIAICGMQNMVEFIRPEWFELMSAKTQSNCIQHKNNSDSSSCDSHLDGVKLAAFGVYWKFLCYKTNTMYGMN